MIRVVELIKLSAGLYEESASYISRDSIVSLREDTAASKRLSEQKGRITHVSRLVATSGGTSREMLVLGHPDSILGEEKRTKKGLLRG